MKNDTPVHHKWDTYDTRTRKNFISQQDKSTKHFQYTELRTYEF